MKDLDGDIIVRKPEDYPKDFWNKMMDLPLEEANYEFAMFDSRHGRTRRRKKK